MPSGEQHVPISNSHSSPHLRYSAFRRISISPIDLSPFMSYLMKQEKEICPCETTLNQRDVFTPDEPAGVLSASRCGGSEGF